MSQNQKASIVFIGECMIQLQETQDGLLEKSFAGDSLNTATYLARLQALHGVDVHFMTALGLDDFSQQMIDAWQSDNIHCEEVRRIAGKNPGLYAIQLAENGERSFTYWRGESAAKDLFKPETQPRVSSLGQFHTIYLSGISLAILDTESRNRLIALLEKAKLLGSRICFDNNFRPALWRDVHEAQHWYARVLRLTDVAFLTHDDEQALWGDVSVDDTLARNGTYSIPETVIKCGAEPCVIQTQDQQWRVPAQALSADRIVDTTAAGDSFSAGYLCGLLKELPRERCAELGHQLAGTVIQYRGAILSKTDFSDCYDRITTLCADEKSAPVFSD